MNIVVFGGEVGGDVRGSWGLMVVDVPNACFDETATDRFALRSVAVAVCDIYSTIISLYLVRVI
jgi:hypothetical protein